MANDVTIVVEASVGDALVKLDLAKHAINDLGDEAEQTDAKMAAASAETGFFTSALGGLNGAIAAVTSAWPGFASPLIALPAVAIAATAAVVALADVFGTLVAITADLVAPLTLVTGLLGGLAAGFVIAAQRAAQGGGPFKDFHKQLSDLHDQFDKVSTDLALRFLPYLTRLADGAKQALQFIDKLAHEPLAKAMHDMATQGVTMLNNFVNQITKVIAQPIRLAFQIAFGAGPGGNEFASTVASWWHRFTDFLFGYSVKHPIRLGENGQVIEITQKHVDGIFQPLIDWFNRHHFTRQGIKIGHDILQGLNNSGLEKNLSTYFTKVFSDAARTSLAAFWRLAFSSSLPMLHAMAQIIQQQLGLAWQQVAQKATTAWHTIERIAGQAISSISSHVSSGIGSAINTVIGIANRFLGLLHQIANFFSQTFTLHISFPSPPSWLTSGFGLLGGGGGSGSTGSGAVGTGGRSGSRVMSNVMVNIHGADLSTPAQRRVISKQIGDDMARRWVQIAGVG